MPIFGIKVSWLIAHGAVLTRITMAERFAFVTKEEINLLVYKAIPENTKKSTSYAINVFDGKLFVNVLSNL